MLYIAADHAGFELKELIKEFLRIENIDFEDVGPKTMEPDDDYPPLAAMVAKKIMTGKNNGRGIVICGTANGVCITANKIAGIRAGIGYNLAAAEAMRAHNDANILCLAGRVLQPNFAKAIVLKFLGTKFSGEKRHARRIAQITQLEK